MVKPTSSQKELEPIRPIDIQNLDGFVNYTYKGHNDIYLLEAQVEALAQKVNEIIYVINQIKQLEKER